MVFLSSIYTKSGDDGSTSLGTGDRVRKDDVRVAAYGAVDETNSMIGMLRFHTVAGSPDHTLLGKIQNDLFDLGADLSVPESPEDSRTRLRLAAGQSEFIETAIDAYNSPLSPLTSFVLPGGSLASSWSHLARTTCRRAERDLVSLTAVQKVNPEALIYLNRLSDLLFVLSRVYNNNGQSDVLWTPGSNRRTD